MFVTFYYRKSTFNFCKQMMPGGIIAGEAPWHHSW